LSLFNFTRLWAGFAECFDQGFYVDAFPERLLTDYVLVSMMFTAQWDYSPIVWLLPYPCTATQPYMSAFDWHLLTTIY
jgi:hypothetical protein